ncbi:hypothetical protein CA267_015115 [Alteromonas pelagimontana]|uniref:Glycosyltransferase family 4 protein n=1 Tax=Alteromonas pelagimontana TaxID=1858656 RepID=A0A6M4MGJ1_9ALTE|nr:hypothetical protein [Alteromonas pelagimontana]QJR81988.1 hypothetical protein CA267_015115 [Alteromonas pelagimontana]
MYSKSAWITWERQPRNRSMADLFNAKYFEFSNNGNGIKRYLLCLKDTYFIFNSKSYSLIFVQNPSIILCFISVILSKIFTTKLVIDAHNAGVYPNEGKSKFLLAINNWILKRADLVLVTNRLLVDHLNKFDIKSEFIPDPLPSFPQINTEELSNGNYLFVVCSWSLDEPIDLYIEVARMLPEYVFKFSGNYKKYSDKIDFNTLPDNVVLLGFISEDEYVKTLANCLAVLDLTTRDDCLVCGAYESISLLKPVVVSDTVVNRELFHDSVCYSELNSASLINAIHASQENSLIKKVEIFREEYSIKITLLQQKICARLNYSIKCNEAN